MVLAAGCLIVLAVAVPFVVGRLALDVERTLEPERVTVGDRAVAVMRVTNPAPGPDQLPHHRGARRRAERAARHPAARRRPQHGCHLPAAHGPAWCRRRRSCAHRQVRPPAPDAARDRAGRCAAALGPPPRRRPRPASGRVRQGPRGADVGRLPRRRRGLPRPAGVRAGRRSPPHPLDVVGPHRDPDGPPLRRQPPAQHHRRRRHRRRVVRVRRRARPGHRGRRLARRLVDAARSAGGGVARRECVLGQRRAAGATTCSTASRWPGATTAPTSPTPPSTPFGPRSARRRSSWSRATCPPTASCGWPPSPAARRGSCSCGSGRPVTGSPAPCQVRGSSTSTPSRGSRPPGRGWPDEGRASRCRSPWSRRWR